MSEGKHTPLPWTATRFNVRGPDGRKVAEATLAFKSSTETAANAALIVEAVNNYHTLTSQRDKLVKALEEIQQTAAGPVSKFEGADGTLRAIENMARTAISQTKEGV